MSKKSIPGDNILEEVIIIFDEVNSKIDGLIDCSVKDFEILNSNFKSIFYNLQRLSEASGKVLSFIKLINISENEKPYKKYSSVKKLNLLQSLNSNISILKKLDKNINYSLLILSNIKQDTSTIKLLITNLKFDPIISTDYAKLNNSVSSVSQSITKNEKKLLEIRLTINDTIKLAEEGIYHNTEILTEYINNASDSINYLRSLGAEAEKYDNKLTTLENKKASSTSAIITKLQFQDILRQQIEHVQTAHKETTSNLKNSHKEGEPLSEEDLFKIRDINILQSAQLVHANREYQNAVEVILHKINELTSFLAQHNTFWNQFCKPEGIKLQSLQPAFSELLNNLNSHFFSFSLVFEKFNSSLNEIQDNYLSLIKLNYLTTGISSEIDNIQQIIKNLKLTETGKEKFNPIVQVRNELDKLNNSSQKLSKAYLEGTGAFDIKKLFKTNYKPEINTIKNFIKTIEKLNELFQDNTGSFNLHLQLQKTTNFTIEQVAYYKKFESEVQEIIRLLDNLLANINLTRNDIDKEKLEHVKKLYTMESEREIHNIVTGNKDENEEDDDSQIDDSEVEFF